MMAGLDHGHLAVQNCCVTWLGSGLLATPLGGFGFGERWIPAPRLRGDRLRGNDGRLLQRSLTAVGGRRTWNARWSC